MVQQLWKTMMVPQKNEKSNYMLYQPHFWIYMQKN